MLHDCLFEGYLAISGHHDLSLVPNTENRCAMHLLHDVSPTTAFFHKASSDQVMSY
jgi:hypothetical protein